MAMREQEAATEGRRTKPPPAASESGRTYPRTLPLGLVPGGLRCGEDVSRLGGNDRRDAAVKQTRHRCLLGAASVETGPGRYTRGRSAAGHLVGRNGDHRAAR